MDGRQRLQLGPPLVHAQVACNADGLAARGLDRQTADRRKHRGVEIDVLFSVAQLDEQHSGPQGAHAGRQPVEAEGRSRKPRVGDVAGGQPRQLLQGIRVYVAGVRGDAVRSRLCAGDAAVAVVVVTRHAGGQHAAARGPARHVRAPRPPQAAIRLPGLTLVLPELVEVAEREPGVGVAVPLPDDLRVGERAVLEVDVGQRAPVAVGALLVVLQAHVLPLQQPRRERARLLAEALHRPAGIDRLRRIDADQPNAADTLDDDRVAVDDPLDELGGAWRRPERQGDSGKQRDGTDGS